jgi:hypothetical protein
MTALAVWVPPRAFTDISMVDSMEQQIAAGMVLVLWRLRALKQLLFKRCALEA